MDSFAIHLMPQLLTLVNDSGPNVRMALAKTLTQTLLEKECFLASTRYQDAVELTVMILQLDQDHNVKYFASKHPASTKIAEDAMSVPSLTY
jgi:serine/threonine-protein phosphatase 4 regulatory subunit 1